jgi:energy-converting hydrogenase Eha subunit A
MVSDFVSDDSFIRRGGFTYPILFPTPPVALGVKIISTLRVWLKPDF